MYQNLNLISAIGDLPADLHPALPGGRLRPGHQPGAQDVRQGPQPHQGVDGHTPPRPGRTRTRSRNPTWSQQLQLVTTSIWSQLQLVTASPTWSQSLLATAPSDAWPQHTQLLPAHHRVAAGRRGAVLLEGAGGDLAGDTGPENSQSS